MIQGYPIQNRYYFHEVFTILKEKTFNTGTVTLNYAEGLPSGPPLLLLPGMARSWKAFLPVIPSLTPNWHVYALDYRGHGKSGRVPGKYKAIDYFHDLKAFIFENFSEPIVLLGHSMGGGMAFGFAEVYPEKLRGLIVGDASIDQALHIEQMTTRVMQRFYAMMHNHAGCLLEELAPSFEKRGTPVQNAEELSQLDPGVLEYHASGRLAEYFEGVDSVNLDKITCPILLIQGNPEHGGILSDREVEQALTYTHVSHALIENAGHNLGFEKGELTPFMDAVRRFLEKLR